MVLTKPGKNFLKGAINMATKKNTWKFDTKEEAQKKQAKLKHPGDYEVVKARENGKFIKGWVLKPKGL